MLPPQMTNADMPMAPCASMVASMLSLNDWAEQPVKLQRARKNGSKLFIGWG